MMYLKALQRPRRVPMRCSNEGFFYTTTNLVASLHVNLIIFSFLCALAPFCLLLSAALFLLLPLALFFSSPSTFSVSPLRFLLIDTLLS